MESDRPEARRLTLIVTLVAPLLLAVVAATFDSCRESDVSEDVIAPPDDSAPLDDVPE
jgi:hypothetical protein